MGIIQIREQTEKEMHDGKEASLCEPQTTRIRSELHPDAITYARMHTQACTAAWSTCTCITSNMKERGHMWLSGKCRHAHALSVRGNCRVLALASLQPRSEATSARLRGFSHSCASTAPFQLSRENDPKWSDGRNTLCFELFLFFHHVLPGRALFRTRENAYREWLQLKFLKRQ